MGHEAHPVCERPQYPLAPAGMSSLQVVCAWCQQPLGWHWVPIPLPFPISYSICACCYTAVSRELELLTAGAAEPDKV
jgi:hypothetical protein